MKRFALFLATFLFLIPATVAAAVASDIIIVPKGEVIEDNFVRAAQSIEINGEIQGDLIVAGQTVTVNGPVSGDIIAAAQTIRLHGTVGGNVRLAGSVVEIDGVIGKNATIFANTIDLTDEAQIGWSLQAFGSALTHRGTVIGNANFYGPSAVVQGGIQGNAVFQLGEEGSLRLTTPATIGKNLTYHATEQAVVDQGVTVRGTVQQVQPTPSAEKAEHFLVSLVSFWRLVSLFGLLVVGLVLLSIIPKTNGRIVLIMKEKAGGAFGWGLVVFFVTPIVVGILFVTIIGIPLALLTLVLYAALLYVTRVYVGLFIGNWVLSRLWKGKKSSQLWAMIVGVVLYSILLAIPWLGWLLGFVGALWALGALFLAKREHLQTTEK